MPGTLFVIATPLGNLDDLSTRALETLRAADCIACEDTRRTARLLARHEIRRPLLSCHRFNERQRQEELLERLRRGEDVALVSDGGTPGISDPGTVVVQAALEADLPVVPIPGPSAPATLLSVSGLSADRYVFDGFLPHRSGERRRRLRELRDERRTVVLFEAPHRIRDTLADISEILGERPIVLGRELTKIHESIRRGTAGELLELVKEEPRGEITLAVAPASPGEAADDDRGARTVRRAWREALERSAGDRRLALRAAARELGLKRPELQRRLDELGE